MSDTTIIQRDRRDTIAGRFPSPIRQPFLYCGVSKKRRFNVKSTPL